MPCVRAPSLTRTRPPPPRRPSRWPLPPQALATVTPVLASGLLAPRGRRGRHLHVPASASAGLTRVPISVRARRQERVASLPRGWRADSRAVSPRASVSPAPRPRAPAAPPPSSSSCCCSSFLEEVASYSAFTAGSRTVSLWFSIWSTSVECSPWSRPSWELHLYCWI